MIQFSVNHVYLLQTPERQGQSTSHMPRLINRTPLHCVELITVIHVTFGPDVE